MGYFCAKCGKSHEDWPPDLAFQRPDAIWALEKSERSRRCKESDDLCSLKMTWWGRRRYFVRGVLLLPIAGADDQWGIGLWAEVPWREFDAYLEVFHEDARSRPRFGGLLSNDIKGLAALVGTPVEVQLNDSRSRPTFWFGGHVQHPLADMQRSGISNTDIHAILEKGAPSLLALAPN